MSEPTRYTTWMQAHSTGLYVEWSDYDALRKHAESMAAALAAIKLVTDEADVASIATTSLDAYRAAYPKEDSDAQ